MLLLLLKLAELIEALEAAVQPPLTLVLPPGSSGIVEGRLVTITAAGLPLNRSMDDLSKSILVEESEEVPGSWTLTVMVESGDGKL